MTTILDQCLPGKSGRELAFTSGVEVGVAKGRSEFAEHLIRAYRSLPKGEAISFPAFVAGELVKFQRGQL